MRCSAWVCRLWLAVVLWSCVVSRLHCVEVTVHTAHNAAPQDHSQPRPTHPVKTPHAVGHGLILLMMGIMMPETCWGRSLILNIELVASCWFSLFTSSFPSGLSHSGFPTVGLYACLPHVPPISCSLVWLQWQYLAVVSRRSSTRPQPTTAYTPSQNTACSRTRSYSPDDGHNEARNMLR